MPTFPSDRLRPLCIALFVTSTMFPLAASLFAARSAPRWLGIADVAVAALLVAVAIAIVTDNQRVVGDEDRLTAFRASQFVFSVIPALLVTFFIARRRINWDVLVVGLAWRGWLLLYMLPFLSAARRGGRQGEDQ